MPSWRQKKKVYFVFWIIYYIFALWQSVSWNTSFLERVGPCFLSKLCVLLRPLLFPATNLVSFNKQDHFQKLYIPHCNHAYHIQGLLLLLQSMWVLQQFCFIYTQKMQFPYCNLEVLSKDSPHSINKRKDTKLEQWRLWLLSLQSIARKYHKGTGESNI